MKVFQDSKVITVDPNWKPEQIQGCFASNIFWILDKRFRDSDNHGKDILLDIITKIYPNSNIIVTI